MIALFGLLKTSLEIPEERFPRGIICISDGEFNPADLRRTNVEVARASLRCAGFSERYVAEFKIVLWNLQSNHYGAGTGCKFETHNSNVENVFYFSGYSPSTLLFLMGIEPPERPEKAQEPKTMRELVEVALSQELLELVTV